MKLLFENWRKFIEEETPKVISFDFDDTLSLVDSEYQYIGPNKPLLELFREFQNRGFKVYIVTSRLEKNEEMYKERGDMTVELFITEHGLNPDRIIFTNLEDKVHTLRRNGAVLHFDDDEFEIAAIDQIAPEIGAVQINYTNGAIKSGQEHIDRILGEAE
jgi:FMN phosphatase YigB (HAD superfamily)